MAVILIIGVVGIAAFYFLTQSGGDGGAPGGGVGGNAQGGIGNCPPGTRIGADQIATYAQNAGFSGSDLVMAVAVALAESGGDPCVPGDNNTSVGLWQIHFTVHPEFNGWNLTDPQTNANAAYSIYKASGNTFNAWTTYQDGISASFLSQASQGVSSAQGTVIS